jgi:glutathione S-transferase
MKILYYSRGACSLGPHIILEELGQPFEARAVDAAKKENQTAEYKALNPRGHVPVLVDGEFVLTEGVAILFHLADGAPQAKLLPEFGTRARARAYEWGLFISGELHSAYRQVFRPERLTVDNVGVDNIKSAGRTKVAALYADAESRLVATPYIFGEQFSVIDAYLAVFHRWGHRAQFDMSLYPKLNAVAKTVFERPAAQRAMARERVTPTGVAM